MPDHGVWEILERHAVPLAWDTCQVCCCNCMACVWNMPTRRPHDFCRVAYLYTCCLDHSPLKVIFVCGIKPLKMYRHPALHTPSAYLRLPSWCKFCNICSILKKSLPVWHSLHVLCMVTGSASILQFSSWLTAACKHDIKP